jgi:predicted nucleotidyltransferase
MKILGIVAEYNPFHNGHKYHIEKAKELTGADYTVVVMSGNFMQRGEAAIMDKWQRSRLAVENGADLVIELPFIFACNKAQTFASGAVDILAALGVTHIAFGSESGEIDKLKNLVELLDDRNDEIANETAIAMETGCSYAKGTEIAVSKVLGDEYVSLMLDPNNILAVEYLKRIHEKKYDIEAVTVKRHGSGYYDSNKSAGMAGATVIREKVLCGQEVSPYVPENTLSSLLSDKINEKIQKENAFMLIKNDIVRSSADELSKVYHVGEGLENKLKKEIIAARNYDDFVGRIVSKRYTQAAIKRMLAYVMMNLKETEPQRLLYARVLAAGMEGRKLIKLLKKDEISQIPLITNINKEEDICEKVWGTLKYDILASDVYNIISGRNLYEYSDKVIRPYIAL